MKKIKIIYYVGDSIGYETIVTKGNLIEENNCLFIKSQNEIIALDKMCCVELIKINGLGTMIKILNNNNVIFIAAYRIFFNIGTGFAIINYFRTKNIKNKMYDIIKNQRY